MRTFTLIATMLVVLALSARAASSDVASVPELSGKMAQLSYLIGTWSCTTEIPATGKTKVQTISAKSIYWIEPENVIGNYYRSKPYSSSSFFGWMDSKKLWWSSGADAYGAAFSGTGKDSGTNVQVMTGTNWYQGQAATSRDTMTKNSDTGYIDHFEILQAGKVTFQGTSTCRKTSNKTM